MKAKPPVVRESGFYWIREKDTGHVTIAKWIDPTQSWTLTGWAGFLQDDEAEVIGPRLEPPTQ